MSSHSRRAYRNRKKLRNRRIDTAIEHRAQLEHDRYLADINFFAKYEPELIPDWVYAYKRANLLVKTDSNVELAVLAFNGSIVSFDDLAVCKYGRSHTAPDPSCSCGFYAYTSVELADKLLDGLYFDDYVTLRVALSGTILEFSKGYRAGRQIVTDIAVKATQCVICGRTDPIEALIACASSRIDDDHYQMLGSICATCIQAAYLDQGRIYSLEELTILSGVNIEWRTD